MAKKQITAVGLAKLEYAAVPASGLPSAWTEIEVVHEDTFSYEQAEDTADDYINEIDGEVYESTLKKGTKSLNFSIGKYDLELKSVFMGGTYTAATAATTEPVAPAAPAKWVPADDLSPIYKAFRATTLDGVTITIPKGKVSAVQGKNKKAIGLTIKVTPMKPDDTSLKAEIWEDGDVSA